MSVEDLETDASADAVEVDAPAAAASPLPSRLPRNLDRLFLVLLVGAFVCQGLLFAALTPPWQAPDEPANLAAIARIAGVRSLGPSTDGVPNAIARSMIQNRFAGLVAWPGLPPLASTAADDVSRERSWQGIWSRTVSLYNPVAVPVFVVGASHGILGAMYAVRALDIAFGALAVFFTFLLAKELRIGSPTLPMLSAAVVAFVPQFGFITSSVSKDAMAIALGTAALWLIAGTARRGVTARRLAWAAVVVVLGAMTKPTLLALGVPLLTTAAIAVYQSAGPRRVRRAGLVSAVLGAPGLLVLLLAAAGSHRGLDYVRVLIHSTPTTVARTLGQRSFLAGFVTTSWGNFSWLSAPLGSGVLVALTVLMGLAGVGLIRFASRSGRRLLQEDPPAVAILAGLVTAVVSLAAIVLAGQANGFGTQGRFAFPAIGAFGVLFALGLSTLAPVIRGRRGVLTAIVLASGFDLLLLLRQFPDRFNIL